MQSLLEEKEAAWDYKARIMEYMCETCSEYILYGERVGFFEHGDCGKCHCFWQKILND